MGGPIKVIFEVGRRFGRLTVSGEAVMMVKELKSGTRKMRGYPCKCECGNQKTIPISELTSGRTRSCGCLHAEGVKVYCRTHGEAKTPLYKLLMNMIARCENPNIGEAYQHYGGARNPGLR